MYSVQIELYCEGSKAPKFSSFDDAKRCFDAGVDFLVRSHPYEYLEVRLIEDGLCVLSTFVNPAYFVRKE